MRTVFLFFFFFGYALQSVAQALSVQELLAFRQMDPDAITPALTKKGWTFMVDNKPTDKMMGRTIWAYRPAEVGNAEAGAEAWCVLYSLPHSTSRILYNHFGESVMRKITKSIKRKKMHLLEEGTNLKGVAFLSAYTDFADNTFVFRVMTYNPPYGFGIKIFEKQDYLHAKANNQL